MGDDRNRLQNQNHRAPRKEDQTADLGHRGTRTVPHHHHELLQGGHGNHARVRYHQLEELRQRCQVVEEHPGARQRGRREDDPGEQVRHGGQAGDQQGEGRDHRQRERSSLPRDLRQDKREHREGVHRPLRGHPREDARHLKAASTPANSSAKPGRPGLWLQLALLTQTASWQYCEEVVVKKTTGLQTEGFKRRRWSLEEKPPTYCECCAYSLVQCRTYWSTLLKKSFGSVD